MGKISRRVLAAAVTAGVAATGTSLAGGIPGATALADGMRPTPTVYGFRTLDDRADPAFNQLLGINNDGTIAGYFGSGAAGHPNQGYRLLPPHGHGSYQSENFPGAAQTQVTGLNNTGVTVGFWSSANNASLVNDNSGFWALGGQFHNANFPASAPASPPVDQRHGRRPGLRRAHRGDRRVRGRPEHLPVPPGRGERERDELRHPTGLGRGQLRP